MLEQETRNTVTNDKEKLHIKIFLVPVRLYQRFISPLKSSCCTYSPTCSQYTIDAVKKHGIIKGTILGGARILRCSALFIGGYDPVPDKFSFKAIKNQYSTFRVRKHPSQKQEEP
ncbi:MAG: membrane protein insertion efficiency factor YidD [Sphaerochaetaceae bacterium]|nr:membrane protein insertion efficiency factor YidD [Sphaerochaetaceae bacterium]